MIPIRHLRQSVLFCLAATCATLALAQAPPAWSQSDDTAAEAAKPADAPKRPTLPDEVAAHVGELEERIEELKKSSTVESLTEAIALAREVLALRLEYQGSESGWTNMDGEPTEWYEVGDARRDVEYLILRASLPLEQRIELVEAEAIEVKAGELYDQGLFDESFTLVQAQLEIYQRVLGNEHRATVSTIGGLGLLHLVQGRYTKAEPYLREDLDSSHRMLGNHHPGTFIAINNIGMLLSYQGRFSEAESYAKEALEGQRWVLSEDHPDTLISISNLGYLIESQGKYGEAEAYAREALEHSRRVLGNKHPATLISIGNLGGILRSQGRFAEAEQYYRETLRGDRQVLGDDHMDTLLSINNMGILLQSQGKHAEAELYIREALQGNRRVLGDDHPDTLLSIRNLGSILNSQGKYAEAEPYYWEAVEGYRRVLGSDHPDTMASINNIGGLFFDQGKYTEAELNFREALDRRQRVSGDDHPETLTSRFNMGYLFFHQGRYLEAEPYFEEALKGQRRVLGDHHPRTIKSLNQLALLLYRRGEYAAAESMWIEAANSFEETRLRMGAGGLERVHYAAQESPLTYLAACLARNGKPLPAWQRLEASLARGLLDTLSARHTRPLNAGEQRREENLIGQLNKIDEWISTLIAKEQDTEEFHSMMAQLVKERESLQADLSRFGGTMMAKYGVAAGEVYTLRQIQARLPADTAILAWVDIKGDQHAADPNGEHWACIVKSQGNSAWINLPGSGKDETWTNEDETLAQQLGRKLGGWATGPSAQWRLELVDRLYQQRIAPIEPHLSDIRHLIVLPAGRMTGVPIEVLTDAYTVTYAPSGTLYAWLRETALGKDQKELREPGPLLALGDPAYPGKAFPVTQPSEPPDHGVLITMVIPDSNALRSGLEDDDVLMTYGGTQLRNAAELGPAIRQSQESAIPEGGERVPVTVWRDGEILEVDVAPGRLGVRAAKQTASEAISTKRRLDDVLAKTRGQIFNPIPHTRREVESIAELFKQEMSDAKTEPLILLGSEASEQRLHALAEAGELKKYRYLHLATHGVMDDKIAMNSAMILSQDNLPDAFEQAVAGKEIYDGRLTAEQIVRTWKLDADLVTLSGCDTALGEDSGGEGFLGFSQALFVAGARSLLLSLWKVDDQATMLMMNRFYENLLGKYDEARSIPDQEFAPGSRMAKAEALREAKVWLRNLTADQLVELELELEATSGDRGTIRKRELEAKPATDQPYGDPQFWASFILIGDPG